jgi:serine/threonine-protein kinase PknK
MDESPQGDVTPRVAIADDDAQFRASLSAHLRRYGIDVCATVPTAARLLDVVQSDHPDAVTVDLRMPWEGRGSEDEMEGGLEAVASIRRELDSPPAILVVSSYGYPSYVEHVLAQGVRRLGYVLKDNVFEGDLVAQAVRRIIAGDSAVDPLLIEQFFRRRAIAERCSALTQHERMVLKLMAEGYSNRGIGGKLFISSKTVEVHISHIFDKLGIADSPDINRRVRAVLNWLEPD